jgi:RNA polymerase-binding transcription factor DksA
MTDIAAAKSRLESRRTELQQRLARVDADQHHRDEPLVQDFEEQANQTGNDEVLGAIGDTVREELAQVDAALGRIAAGHYGECAACGKMIEGARLSAVPYALRCAACA